VIKRAVKRSTVTVRLVEINPTEATTLARMARAAERTSREDSDA
jgi:hypothetical protein